MRRLVVLSRMSMDGFYASPDGKVDWFVQDPQVDEASHELTDPDTTVFGRLTYQMFERVWPAVAADPDAPKQARAMGEELNRMTKVVFSTTLTEVSWENSVLADGDVAGRVRELKQGDGRDIVVFGSGTIAHELARHGLVDDFVVVLTPVVLGGGKRLFDEQPRSSLRLRSARTFDSGNVLLHYQPDSA